jgi:hypothetical protein
MGAGKRKIGISLKEKPGFLPPVGNRREMPGHANLR